MLLLVVEPDLDQRRDGPKLVLAGLAKEFDDGRVDIFAIGADLAGAGTGDVAAMTPLEYDSARTIAMSQARNDFLSSTFLSDDFLKQQYSLDLLSWHKQEEPAK